MAKSVAAYYEAHYRVKGSDAAWSPALRIPATGEVVI